MSVERKTLREAGLAAVGVLVFLAFLLAGGATEGGGSPTGALFIVGGMVAFILVMAVIGLLFLGED